jgi:uroporphyrinogen decarboxylase
MEPKMIDRPLTCEEMASAIEGRSIAPRVPMLAQFWVQRGADTDWQRAVDRILGPCPEDAQVMTLSVPGPSEAPADDPTYRWVNYDAPAVVTSGAYDSRIALPDWSHIDDVLANFPSPRSKYLVPASLPPDGRYRLGVWWFCFFERHWSLRGMENAMFDFYNHPAEVHRLYRAFTDFYLALMERGKRELNLDGIFTSDDLGGQTGPMFSPAVFDEFFAPYYRELTTRAHELGMHFWLHCCGNIVKFIPKFVDLGLDVLHPIQKYTMDERQIARDFGDRLTVLAGFDVQRIIPWGTPEDVRREVRFMIDTYLRPEGRLVLGAGNAIHEDCPPASLEALIDEALGYGRARVAKLRG